MFAKFFTVLLCLLFGVAERNIQKGIEQDIYQWNLIVLSRNFVYAVTSITATAWFFPTFFIYTVCFIGTIINLIFIYNIYRHVKELKVGISLF